MLKWNHLGPKHIFKNILKFIRYRYSNKCTLNSRTQTNKYYRYRYKILKIAKHENSNTAWSVSHKEVPVPVPVHLIQKWVLYPDRYTTTGIFPQVPVLFCSKNPFEWKNKKNLYEETRWSDIEHVKKKKTIRILDTCQITSFLILFYL